jgi:hypothetical protein
MSTSAFDCFKSAFDAFSKKNGFGAFLPEIGLQLTTTGAAQLRAAGGFQLRADGTEFSTLTMIDFLNPGNMPLDGIMGF